MIACRLVFFSLWHLDRPSATEVQKELRRKCSKAILRILYCPFIKTLRDERYQQEAKPDKDRGDKIASRFRRCRWHLPRSLWAAVSQKAQSQLRILLNWFAGVNKSCMLPPAMIYLMKIICLFHIKLAHRLLTFSLRGRQLPGVRRLQASLCYIVLC